MSDVFPSPILSARNPQLRNTIIALCVVVFHVAGLWALQSGLLRRAVEIIVPAQILSEFIEPPKPKEEPPPPPPPKAVVPLKREPPPPPMPVAVATPDPTPAPNAPVGVVAPQPPPPPITAPVKVDAPPSPPPPAPTPPAPAKVVLPSSDADYLQNPKPPYPSMSKRLNEQGKVEVRVLIGVDGKAQKAELRKSSGFDRLDQSALTTVMQWRYVPGKRDGVAEAMWFIVPISFLLE